MSIDIVRRFGAASAIAVCGALALVLPGCSEPPQPEQTAAPEAAPESAPADAEAPATATTPGDDTVLATVNGKDITQGEVNESFLQMVGPQVSQLPPEQVAGLRAQATPSIVDGLVTQVLLLKAAEEAGTAPTEEELNAQIDQIRANAAQAGASFDEVLKERGVSLDEVKENISQEMALRSLINKQLEGVSQPSDEEVTAFYEENKQRFVKPPSVNASHILIGVPKDATDEQKAELKAKATDVRQQLVKAKGKNFAELAGKFSDDPGSKGRGGQLGEILPGRTVEPFDKAAFSQKVGEIGEIVESPFGYHIILVEDRTDEEQVPLPEVKEFISSTLQNQQREKAMSEYLDGLKKGANISYPEGSPAAPPANAPADAAAPAQN